MNLAIIPARGGSRGIPGKNLRKLAGRTLIEWAVVAARGAALVDGVAITTESGQIADEAHRLGVPVIYRPEHLSTCEATIDAVLAHAIEATSWTDTVVLLQPTSPLRTATHVREAIALLRVTGADSVVGVVAGHETHFAGRMKPRELYSSDCGADECCPPISTYYQWQPFSVASAAERPRTQALGPRGYECGAIYVFTRAHWEATGNRMGGEMVAYPMDKMSGWDVDTEADLDACRALAERVGM